MKSLVYKIRRSTDGLYSTGGSRPRFNDRGKAWTSIGGLKNHLNLVLDGRTRYIYDECVVVTFSMVTSVTEHSVDNLIELYGTQMEEKKKLKELNWQRQKTDAEIKRYEDLKAKYGE